MRGCDSLHHTHTLQISSCSLIQFNALEKSFEVAGPETLMVFSLDYLEEDSGPILHGLCEDLQKVAVVIIINQNLQFLQLIQVLCNLDFRVSKTLSEQIIVGVRNVEEFLSSCPQVCDSFDDVMGSVKLHL